MGVRSQFDPYLGFDTIRSSADWDLDARVRYVMLLVQKGFLHQILLSHDVCMKSHLHTYGGNGYDYVLTNFVPRLLQAGLSKEQVQMLLVQNPTAALAGTRADA